MEKNKKTYPIVKKYSCTFSYKTLATKFNFGIKKDDIEEMIGIFYIPCNITFSRSRNDTASSNNQAVTNIIDSFSNIEKIGLSNLEERWIDGVKSFATYMPSGGKMEGAEQKGYQFTSVRGSEFILNAEKSIEKSKKKIKECANEYFDEEFSTVDEIKNIYKCNLKASMT